MCKIVEELRDEAKLEARIEEKQQMVVSMIEDGTLSFEQIAKIAKLSLDEVKALAEGRPA